MDYTPEDLASVPPVQYDPYERELRPLLYFTPPYKTRFDTQFEKAIVEEPRDAGDAKEPGEEADAVSQLKELLGSIGDDRDARWVTALEEATGLLSKALAYLIKKGDSEVKDPVGVLAKWALQALSMEVALTQPIALNLRQLKAGAKLASHLTECPQGLTALLREGALGVLLELLHADHLSSTLKLCILRALDALTSAPAGVEAFLHAGESEKSGYQVSNDEQNLPNRYSAQYIQVFHFIIEHWTPVGFFFELENKNPLKILDLQFLFERSTYLIHSVIYLEASPPHSPPLTIAENQPV